MRSEKGVSLLEVMVAITLMGIVFVAYTGALYTASKAVAIADERAAAESLARTEMEYVRSQGYSEAPWDYTLTSSEKFRSNPGEPTWWDDDKPPLLGSDYAGYSVTVSAEGLLVPSIDNEIQMITVTVAHQDGTGEIRDIITLEGYRSMR
jgi:prepilin-type N-terminal cleavage/methylation domain-containing protein